MKLKMKKTIMAFVASLAAASLMLGGCTEEKAGAPEVDEGVVFEFSMHKVYEMDIDAIDEIAAVKITLVRDGERIELPTMNVSGSAEFLSGSLGSYDDISVSLNFEITTGKVGVYLATETYDWNSYGTTITPYLGEYTDDEDYSYISAYVFFVKVE